VASVQDLDHQGGMMPSADDRTDLATVRGHTEGNGIRNMSDRVAALGGILSAGTIGGTFTRSARVPLRGAGPPGHRTDRS
jgi:hypothetical protein